MAIQELRQKRKALIDECRKIHDQAKQENRALTDEEKKVVDEKLAEAGDVLAKIRDEEREEALQAAVADLNEPRQVVSARPQPASEPPSREPRNAESALPAMAKSTRALRAFRGPDADYRAYGCGQWIRGVLFGNQDAMQWAVAHGFAPEGRVMTTKVNTAGGFLVPEPMERSIIDLREQYGVVRQQADVRRMDADTLTIPVRTSGVTGYYVGETDSITASDVAFANVKLTARKLATLTRISSDLAEDSVIDLADWLASEVAYAFAYNEDVAAFNGDGTSTYGGIRGICQLFYQSFTTDHAGSVVVAPTATHDTLPELDYDDITALMSKLPLAARPNAKFYCSQAAADVVFANLSVSTATGGPDPGAAFSQRFLGYPIVPVQVMPSSTSEDYSGKVMILFGDMRATCTIGDRRQIRMVIDGSRYLEYDQIAIQATERFDIVWHNIGNGTTAGWMVGLLGGAS